MKIATLAVVLLLAAPEANAFEFCTDAGKRHDFYVRFAEWKEHFEEKRYHDLETTFGAMLRDFRGGRLDDALLARAFAIFEKKDPGLEPVLRQWARLFPKSQAAQLALGYHNMARGIALAGRPEGGISTAQASASERELRIALRAFDVSDQLGQALPLSNAARIRIASRGHALKALGAAALYRETIKAHPNALEVRIQYLKNRDDGVDASLARIAAIMKEAEGMREGDRHYIAYLGYQEMGEIVAPEQPRRAGEFYERSIPFCPGLGYSLSQAIRIYEGLGDTAAVERTASLMIDRDAHSGFAYAKRGKARKDGGRLDEAFADYKRAADLANPDAFAALAWFYENGKVVARDAKKAAEFQELADARRRQ